MKTIWRSRDFMLLFSGQTVSSLGTAISSLAIPWLTLQVTHSAFFMGVSFAVSFIPYIIFSLPSGVWADRYSKRSIMALTDLARMILILSLPLVHFFYGRITLVQLLLVGAGMSALSALFDPAYMASLPSLVKSEELQEANSLVQVGVQACQIIGPPLSGVLIVTLGIENTIYFDAFSYLLSVVCIIVMKNKLLSDFGEKPVAARMIPAISEGLRYVWGHPLIRTIGILTLLANFGSSATEAVMLYRLQHDLHVAVIWVGTVMTAASVGGLVGALASGFITKELNIKLIVFLVLLLQIFPPFLIAVTRSPFVIAVSNFVIILTAVVWNVQSMSIRQAVIPKQMLGRALSSIRMIVWVTIPIGSLVGGAVGNQFGSATVYLLAGLISLITWIWAVFSGKLLPTSLENSVQIAE